MGIKVELQALAALPATRADIYQHVRALYPGVHSLCSATASEYIKRAGGVTHVMPWTLDLYRELRGKGWIHGHNLKAAQRHDFIFTIDGNHNGAPDHVYQFLRWLDEGKMIAEVIDNYSRDPHPRNVGKPATYKGKRYAKGAGADLWRPPI